MALAPDTFLQSRYRIVRQLGQGGMGTVYEALDQRLNTTVALKESHFTEERLSKQFEREAQLLARLRHPAMTRVIDHFSEEDGQFLVMDYIAGEDLWEKLERNGGAFPVEDVLKWADQLLDALEYLHSQDPPIIHRDIKPQNLKLTSRNQIILLDFGLAKGFAGQISRVTTSGSIFGYTPNYAPLEQIHGTGTDARSDLYSLAATLYHLLTGKIPPDALSRAMASTSEQPDPLRLANEVNPKVSAELAEVIQRAMAQNPSKRFSNAAEMRGILQKSIKSQVFSEKQLEVEDLPSTIILPAPTKAAREEKILDVPPTVAKPLIAGKNQERNATVASATVASPTASSLITSETSSETYKPLESSEKSVNKSKRLLWVLGVALLLVGIVVTIIVKNSSDAKPQSMEAGTPKFRTVDDALLAYLQAIQDKDVEGFKNVISRKLFKTFEENSVKSRKSVDEEIRYYVNNSPIDKSLSLQEQKIEGDKAWVQANLKNSDVTGRINFVEEDNQWKVSGVEGLESQFSISPRADAPAPSDDTKATVDPKSPRGRAESVLSQARAGGDFGELARGYSEDPTSVRTGGDLGWFERGQTKLDKSLEDKLFTLKSGEVSDIIESRRQFDIYKVEEHYSEEDMSGRTIKERIHLRVIRIMTGK